MQRLLAILVPLSVLALACVPSGDGPSGSTPFPAPQANPSVERVAQVSLSAPRPPAGTIFKEWPSDLLGMTKEEAESILCELFFRADYSTLSYESLSHRDTLELADVFGGRHGQLYDGLAKLALQNIKKRRYQLSGREKEFHIFSIRRNSRSTHSPRIGVGTLQVLEDDPRDEPFDAYALAIPLSTEGHKADSIWLSFPIKEEWHIPNEEFDPLEPRRVLRMASREWDGEAWSRWTFEMPLGEEFNSELWMRVLPLLNPQSDKERIAVAYFAARRVLSECKWWELEYSLTPYPIPSELTPWAMSHFLQYGTVTPAQCTYLWCYAYNQPLPAEDLTFEGGVLTHPSARQRREELANAVDNFGRPVNESLYELDFATIEETARTEYERLVKKHSDKYGTPREPVKKPRD